jgi:hypothetical protein
VSDENGNLGNNGNGKTGGKTGNGQFQPGADPRRGHGVKGRSGRPPSVVRAKLRNAAYRRIETLRAIADDPKADAADRLKAIDMMLRYGVGSMTTGTLDVTHRTIDDVLLERARKRGIVTG